MPWWPVAKAVMEAGWDCVVLDPEAEESDAFYDGNPEHGVVYWHHHPALSWTILVSELEPDIEDVDDDHRT